NLAGHPDVPPDPTPVGGAPGPRAPASITYQREVLMPAPLWALVSFRLGVDEVGSAAEGRAGFGEEAVQHLPDVEDAVGDLEGRAAARTQDAFVDAARVVQQELVAADLEEQPREAVQLREHRRGVRVLDGHRAEIDPRELRDVVRAEGGAAAVVQRQRLARARQVRPR